MVDIVFITDSLVRGGAETQLTRIAAALADRGWSVGIISLYAPNDFEPDLATLGLPCFQCAGRSGSRPLRMAWKLWRKLREWKPAVVVTFNFYGDLAGRLGARLAGVPVVVASQRTAVFKSPWRRRVYQLTEVMVDHTISNSRAAMDLMIIQRGLPPGKASLIPNALDLDRFPGPIQQAESRESWRVPTNGFLWAAVGSLTPAKDYPTLLEAVALLARERLDFQVLIAGKGRLHEAVAQEVERLGLENRVHLLGPLDQDGVARLLSAADALVLSSAWEGLPNTVMEAMASALPVVATDVGGVGEVVDPGVTGLIVPPGDPSALAAAMECLMQQPPEARKAMGLRGRALVESRYQLGKVVDRWCHCLKGLAADKGISLPSCEP